MDFNGQLVLALAINIGLKCITFLLTTYVTRLLLPEQSGINFTYLVYSDTVLFIAREAMRNVAARYQLAPPDAKKAAHSGISAKAVVSLVNLSAVSVPVAVGVMLLLEGQNIMHVHVFPSLSRVVASPVATTAMVRVGWESSFIAYLPEVTVGLSVLCAACAEPCIVLAQSLNLFRVVVLADFAAITARLMVTIGLVWMCGIHSTLEARMIFAFAALGHAVAHVGYLWLVCSGRRLVHLLGGSTVLDEAREVVRVCEEEAGGEAPIALPFPWSVLHPTAVTEETGRQWPLLRSFLGESLLRLLLTEGESFALTAMGSHAVRGYYSMVSNLGSLVARLVFRVWENACSVKWNRDVQSGNHTKAAVHFQFMMRVSLYFGFAFVLLGPPAAATFLTTLYSARWSSPGAVMALQWYCWTIPFMGWNGLLEAFLRAVASPATMVRVQRWMLVESLVYVALCFVVVSQDGDDATPHSRGKWKLLGGGVVGQLILVNLVNMLLRIARSTYLIVSSSALAEREGAEGVRRRGATITLSSLVSVLRIDTSVSMVILFVASRAMPVTIGLLFLIACTYVGSILALDGDVRRVAVQLLHPTFSFVTKRAALGGAEVVKVD